MNRDKFLETRREDWQQFEMLLGQLMSRRQSRWASRDIADLSRLYRSICYDLSLVQSREWGARLEQYLNDLVARGHNCLYRSPPHSLSSVRDFLAFGFPSLLRRRWRAFVLALSLFLIPLLVSAWIGYARPDLAELVVGREAMEQAVGMYREQLYDSTDARYTAERSQMAGFYISNNTGIAFQAYALGILAGIGTCFVLLSNGIGIGIVMGAILADGNPTADHFFSFVITHGALELTAIVIAGAAGLILAEGIFMPGNRTRMDSLRVHGKESLLLALGAGIMLFLAALVEGYFSPLPIWSGWKYVAGSLLWLLVILYFTLAGRERTGS